MSKSKSLWHIMLFILLCASQSFSAYVLHVYNPWVDDGAKSNWELFVTGGGSGWGAGSTTKMTDEGGGWFSYSFPEPLVEWWDWEVWICPPGDQNCNSKGTWTGTGSVTKEKIAVTFGTDKEIWLTPNADGTYTKTFAAPDAKIIWFKSPWGNRLVPSAVFGSDTVKMRPAENADMCGWFYSYRKADSPHSKVQFLKSATRFAMPQAGTLDLSATLGTQDTVFVDGTGAAPAVGGFTSKGACFDRSYTIHLMHPFPDSSIQREYAPGISISDNVMTQPTATVPDEIPYWYKMDFAEGFAFKNGVIAFHGKNQWGNYNVKHPNTFKASELFGDGIYEVWVFFDPDGSLRASAAPIEVRYIRFFNPWENTAPRIVLNGVERKMRTVENRCGWFETILFEYPGTFQASFKQALGQEVYGAEGVGDTTIVSMDSAFALSDTAWVYPNPRPMGPARIVAENPGFIGACPIRDLAVILYDQANLGGADDFEQPPCAGLQTGLVEKNLGIDGLPVAVPGGVPECKLVDLASWFKPKEIVPGYTNATCRDIRLNLDEDGFWLADIDEDTEKGIDGFFPLDDFTHLDDAKTVVNPYFQSNTKACSGNLHNFYFTMHINATFEYVPGQYFEFRGDDDVWVFIDNELVVDLGGLHMPVEGTVDLDTLGLIPDQTYNFVIFFAERNMCGSNFKMRTSINLKTERSYFKVPVVGENGVQGFEIWQIEKGDVLACDFNADVPADTVKAPSNFEIEGPQFSNGPEPLKPGVNYGGITISESLDMILVDTTAIIRTRSLAPGTYKITFTNGADASLSESMLFVVPSYPLPNIVWTDSLWQYLDPTTVTLGEWAFVAYPVYLEARYVGVRCENCFDEVEFKSNDSLVFMDANRNPLTKIALDSGRAQIYVMALQEVKGGSFTASGTSLENELLWPNVNLKEPPVPIVRFAQMHDRNGDGVADSLKMAYSRPITLEDTPDSIAVKWGEDADWVFFDRGDVEAYRVRDSFFVAVGDLFGEDVYTGRVGEAYKGNSTTWYIYVPEDGVDMGKEVQIDISMPVEDKVGPVVLRAEVGLSNGLYDSIFVYLSESVTDTIKEGLVEFKMFRDGIETRTALAASITNFTQDSSRLVLLFPQGDTKNPRAGDSLRLVPGVLADLSGNLPHKNNPLVKILGRKRAEVDAINMVTLSPDEIRPEGENVKVHLVPASQSSKDIYKDIGLPGHLIQLDMGETILNDPDRKLTKDDVSMKYEVYYYTNIGGYVSSAKGSVKCTDAELFGGDCTKSSGNLYLSWDLRSEEGRFVGTGVYVVYLKYTVMVKGQGDEVKENTQNWGVRREP